MKDQLNILFATDFSPNAKNTLRLLKYLQKSYQTTFSFIYAIPSFWKDWFASGKYQKEAHQRLASWQLALTKKQDKKRLSIEYGNPADIILQKARLNKTNLIVLGGKSETNVGRYKTGTTIESVIRHAKKSVWVCKNHTISKLICGIDGSPSSAKALKFAIDLCHRFSASLSIVFVLPDSNFNPLGMSERETQKQEEKFKTQKIKKIEAFLKRFDFSDLAVKTFYPWGIPADIILDMAEDFNHDLIIVGAKGHSSLHHLLIGSTAEKILRHTPCSLLVVR